jgi:hypothetical protein
MRDFLNAAEIVLAVLILGCCAQGIAASGELRDTVTIERPIWPPDDTKPATAEVHR